MYIRQSMKSNYSSSVSGPYLQMRDAIRRNFPNMKKIHGMFGVVMHEGQMMDGRMCINTLLTSSISKYTGQMNGSSLANYTEFIGFIKDKDGKIRGARVRDNIKNEEFDVHAKQVVNCTGIHADELRIKADPEMQPRIQGSRGTHLIFKRGILPLEGGIIIPKTRDGRLLFICNYLGHPMVGTTDEKCEITHNCKPTDEEVAFICRELEPYFGEDFDFKANLLSAWAGIRPLVKEFHSEPSEQQIKE